MEEFLFEERDTEYQQPSLIGKFNFSDTTNLLYLEVLDYEGKEQPFIREGSVDDATLGHWLCNVCQHCLSNFFLSNTDVDFIHSLLSLLSLMHQLMLSVKCLFVA